METVGEVVHGIEDKHQRNKGEKNVGNEGGADSEPEVVSGEVLVIRWFAEQWAERQ